MRSGLVPVNFSALYSSSAHLSYELDGRVLDMPSRISGGQLPSAIVFCIFFRACHCHPPFRVHM